MRSDLIITRIEPHTKAWHDFRRNGIGGSEIGDICGLVKPEWNRTIVHFHNKVGDIITETPDNPKMFFGRVLEDTVAEMWKYYDGSELGYIENFKNNRVIRTCRNLNGFVVNPKYPWLFGSLDRLMNIKGGMNLITGQPLTTEAILECKCISYNASRQWEDGTPPSYIAQVHIYMIIMETDYAELAVLRDGNDFFVERVARDEALCQRLISVSKAFWENRVLPAKEAYAKKLVAEKAGNMRAIEDAETIIQQHEPNPDSSTHYRDFMNKKFLQERESIEGTMTTYDLCKRDKVLIGVKNIIDDARMEISNTLVKELTLAGAEEINFGRLGNCTFSERKGSKNRVFSNRIKESPSEDQLLTEFKKLDLECY
jgi:putative phage-type endonuclease